MFSVVVLLIRHQSVPGPGPGSACQHDGILTAAVSSSPEITVSLHVRINSSSVRYHTYLLNILCYTPASKSKTNRASYKHRFTKPININN